MTLLATPTTIQQDTAEGGCATPQARSRLDSVDLLRGLVMVIMALDHARDYLTNARFDPCDLTRTTAALFLTRWITHFCAPTFMFLAGVGAFLGRRRGKTTRQLAGFLLTRGIWLIVLEFTIVRVGWQFSLCLENGITLLVIWALGASMIVLAGLVFLPDWIIAAFALALIAGHNLFDRVSAADLGAWGLIWQVLHEPGQFQTYRFVGYVLYPLVPWIGVMAAGYFFGRLLTGDAVVRRRRLIRLGVALTAAFVFLRAANIYGDPLPWAAQKNGLFTLFSFLNVTKYPPSLLFLLVTLGPAIAALAIFEQASGPLARFLITFGRVPLFFYVLHIYVIHALTVGCAMLQGVEIKNVMQPFNLFPENFGYGLPLIYMAWAAVVLALQAPCRWFAEIKRRHPRAWLSYL